MKTKSMTALFVLATNAIAAKTLFHIGNINTGSMNQGYGLEMQLEL